MSLFWTRTIHWLLDVALAVWFFLPLKPQQTRTPARQAGALVCLLAPFPIYVFVEAIPFYSIRFFVRSMAYFLYLRLEKGFSYRRCIYYALITWLSFNICYNIFLTPGLRNWFLMDHISHLPGIILVDILYAVLITLIRSIIPFDRIPEPKSFRICFALLLSAAELFIKEVSDMVSLGKIQWPDSLSLYLLLIQLLLGFSLVLFERYQSGRDQAARDRLSIVASEYRYQSTLAQQQAAEDVRRLHHDMKNHLLAIRQLTGDNDRLNSYVKSLMDELGDYEFQTETGNSLLNGLLSEKVRTAEREGIDISVQVDFRPYHDQMEDMDLCVIFGNLLDNAIEASRKLSDPSRRSVLVKSHVAAGNLVLTFSNFYEGPLHIIEGLPQTTKADRISHGIGLSSVRRSVEKYGGVLSLRTTPEQRLFLTIVFPLCGEQDD